MAFGRRRKGGEAAYMRRTDTAPPRDAALPQNAAFKPHALEVQTRPAQRLLLPAGESLPAAGAERRLYRSLRGAVPIIDASIGKLRRLLGTFRLRCGDPRAEEALFRFLSTVQVNAACAGIDQFIGTYFEELLTCGTAVGEMVLQGGRLAALYNTSIDDVVLTEKSPLEVAVSLRDGDKLRPCAYPELVLVSALNPQPGCVTGTSVLRGLPFVSEVLLKIYQTIGVNWERLGNVRFAVTCKPEDAGMDAAEQAQTIAKAWQQAMRGPGVSDFVAVGDVSIRAIGADHQVLDSNVPVRQMLEQIVAKMGVPPFLLGLSWSSTERMSSQQADMLTSELDAYRALLSPVIARIGSMWLTLQGYAPDCTVDWEVITMQDEVDHANARLLTARAEQLERELKGELE